VELPDDVGADLAGEVRTRRRSRRAAGPSASARRFASSQNTEGASVSVAWPPCEVGTSTQRRLVTSAPRSREVPVWQALGEGNQDSAVSIRISQGGRLFGIVALLRSGGGGPTDPLSGVDGVASEARPTSSNAGGHPSRTG
jgi:hypothetical protein